MSNSMNEKESRKKDVSGFLLFISLVSYWVTSFSFVLSTYLFYDFATGLFVFGFFTAVFTVVVFVCALMPEIEAAENAFLSQLDK